MPIIKVILGYVGVESCPGIHENPVLKSQKQQQQNAKKVKSFQLYYIEIISWQLLGLVVALLQSSHQILHIVCFIGNSALSIVSIY